MNSSEPVTLTRDVEAAIIPVGTKVTLQKGEQAYITQSLGGSYTVIVNGNMFRIEGKDADALGLEVGGQARQHRRARSRRSSWRRKSGTSCAPVTTRKSRSTSLTSA